MQLVPWRFDPPHCPTNDAADPGNDLPVRGVYFACKGVIDFALALVILVLAAPVIVLGALAVILTSRGPAFYSQRRLGLRGRPFRIYKVRTMAHDCERQSGVCWAKANDPRVTPVGRFLRRTHVDELPQLWNVLRGEMSLVGPRPERPEIIDRLEKEIDRYRDRLRVRPGMTGLAQVQLPADSDLEGVRRKVAYDLYYVGALSAWLDVRLLACTALKVLGVPFHVLGLVFRLPRCADVEQNYRGLCGAARHAAESLGGHGPHGAAADAPDACAPGSAVAYPRPAPGTA
jgi:lipopolysaccharide/colanic/teichoic acid biosynthesis glycosyltransferase